MPLTEEGREEKVDHLFELLTPPIVGMLDDIETTAIYYVPKSRMIWTKRAGLRRPSGITMSPVDARQIVNIVASLYGRTVNITDPVFEGALPWGQRFSAMVPPMSRHGTTWTIRNHGKKSVTWESYLETGRVEPEVARYIDFAMKQRLTIAIFGEQDTGKTYLLDALLGHEYARGDRILTIEDAPELKLDQVEDCAQFTADPRSPLPPQDQIEKAFKASLRHEGSRIVIGEARGVEFLEFLNAMQTSTGGGMLTFHASHPNTFFTRAEVILHRVTNNMEPFRVLMPHVINRLIWMVKDKTIGYRIAGIYEPMGYRKDTSEYVVERIAGLPID